ncbi:MAG: Lactose transport system permease protein LacF [Firmicutes bacterium ADurb.Bin182]|nr:MAG: Lactose transport system permease protein LacF [Firmicutes bacterium ADurb.Bin182]
MPEKTERKTHRSVSYAKWGYFFIAPFFAVFIVFQLIPLLSTFYYSLFEYYRVGLKQIGPNFVYFKNYIEVLTGEMPEYALNTLIIWIMGFIPQILVSMLLAVWFTSYRLKLRGQRFFKTVIYMPNLIMASALAMLFFMLFSPVGPVNQMLTEWGIIDQSILFFNIPITARAIIAFMNFLMWFGNTTILLMAGIMGIDQNLFETAQIDGAKPFMIFIKITLPLLMPILVYVLITSMIGGIQMFDIPQVMTNRLGTPDRTTMTLIMYLNRHLTSKNLGLGGAVSVIVFIMTSILSVFVYSSLMRNYRIPREKAGTALFGKTKQKQSEVEVI